MGRDRRKWSGNCRRMCPGCWRTPSSRSLRRRRREGGCWDGEQARRGGGVVGGGAGAAGMVNRQVLPIAPPAQWVQVLAKTGAARFEKDTKSQTVRFARLAGSGTVNGAEMGAGVVPVVEIDGTRYPTR